MAIEEGTRSATARAAVAAAAGTRDRGAIAGLLAAFALLGIAAALGGSAIAFVNLPSLLIVFGGTITVAAVSHGFAALASTALLVLRALSGGAAHPTEIANQVLGLAQRARRDGVLSLQAALPKLRALPFLRSGVALIIDGVGAEEIERAMRLEQQARGLRHLDSAGVLRRAAEIAPAMGLIGTLIGLVQMLAHLDDPARIGPGMAVALLTTFYGAVLANVVLLPLAAKLELMSSSERLAGEICMLAAGSIARQENPRRLETLINTLLPPAQRVTYFGE